MTNQSKLADAFHYHLARGRKATDAIKLARDDIAADKTRSLPSTGIGPRFEESPDRYGESHVRWIERPAEILRFVGLASDIVRLRHTGWLLEDDGFDGDTARGVVYQLPARNGVARFAYGVADPWNTNKTGEGPALLSFDACDDKGDAARWADQMAERYAERERDYRRAWQAGRRYEELGDDIARMRQSCLALIREAKAACDKLPTLVKDTVRDHVESYVRDIRKAREERASLLSDFGRESGFVE